MRNHNNFCAQTRPRYIFKNRRYRLLFGIIDFLGSLIFLPIRPFRRRKPGNVGNILLIRLDHIGDMVYSTPVAHNLKEHYRGAKITMLVANWAKEIVMNNPYLDEVICYNASWFDRKKKRIFEVRRFLKLASELRRHNYDLGFDLRGDFRHILLMFLAGVRFKAGYGITGGGFLLEREAEYRIEAHAIDHNLDLLKAMGIKTVYARPELYGSEKDQKFIEDFLKDNGVSGQDFLMTVHPFAGYHSNRWPNHHFAEVINILQDIYKAKVVIIGTKQDRDACSRIIEMSKVPVINALDKTSLGNLVVLLKKSSLFIGVNSGPTHLAAACGIPVVALFSAANILDNWGPRSENAVVIQKDITCKNCESPDCRHNICMDLISVEDVVDAAEEALRR